MTRWVVVDVAGIQHGGPHLSEQDALMALIELVHELPPAVESPYRVVAMAAKPEYVNH